MAQLGLADRECVPCRGDEPPLEPERQRQLLQQLQPGWELVGGLLRKRWEFPDFASALAFVNRVGEIAEQQRHHPEIRLGWGHVQLEIWTHAINGLSENDFVLAAKSDRALAAP